MVIWLKAGQHGIGLEQGIVRDADVVTLVEVCELTTQAEELLAQAGQEAIDIVTKANESAVTIIKDAESKGTQIRDDAFVRGTQEAASRWIQEVASKALGARESMLKASNRLAELVSLATQHVVETADKEGLYRRALRTVKQLTGESKTLTLHVGPADQQYAESVMAVIAIEVGVQIPLDIRIDPRLTDGGCVLESDNGVLDASLGIQIETVKQAIAKAARNALRMGLLSKESESLE
jgi:type III secretion protein L